MVCGWNSQCVGLYSEGVHKKTRVIKITITYADKSDRYESDVCSLLVPYTVYVACSLLSDFIKMKLCVTYFLRHMAQ